MEFVTAVLVAASLVGLARPELVRRRDMFFLAVFAVAVSLVLEGIGRLFIVPIAVVFMFFSMLAHLAAFGLMVLAAGGLDFADLFREIAAGFRGLGSGGPRGFPVNPPVPPPAGESPPGQ